MDSKDNLASVSAFRCSGPDLSSLQVSLNIAFCSWYGTFSLLLFNTYNVHKKLRALSEKKASLRTGLELFFLGVSPKKPSISKTICVRIFT